MPAQFDFFNAVRVNGVMQGAYDPRLMPQPLVWDKRIPSVNAFDDEIMARFIGFPMIADIIADDAQALTYQFGKLQFESHRIPKLKLGIGLNETMLKQLTRIRDNLATRDDIGVFNNWENRIVSTVRYGVDMRREALLIAMLFDGLTYNRLGIILNNVGWGMYSDLKITVGTTWDQTTATPVNDMLGAKLVAKTRYSVDFDRATMTTTAFRYMTQTIEFQNKARMYLAPNVSYVNLPLLDISGQVKIAQNVLGMNIELDDRRFWSQDNSGVVSSTPLWPTAGVCLSSSQLDGNMNTWDFANGELMEKVVSDLAGPAAPQVAAGYGPTVYPALSNAQLNSPGITYWGVQRGFPRKHFLGANAALAIGTFTDLVSTATPF
jgi:hypothetical protein